MKKIVMTESPAYLAHFVFDPTGENANPSLTLPYTIDNAPETYSEFEGLYGGVEATFARTFAMFDAHLTKGTARREWNKLLMAFLMGPEGDAPRPELALWTHVKGTKQPDPATLGEREAFTKLVLAHLAKCSVTVSFGASTRPLNAQELRIAGTALKAYAGKTAPSKAAIQAEAKRLGQAFKTAKPTLEEMGMFLRAREIERRADPLGDLDPQPAS